MVRFLFVTIFKESVNMKENKINMNFFNLLSDVFDVFEIDKRKLNDIKRKRSYSSYRETYKKDIYEELCFSFFGDIDLIFHNKDNEDLYYDFSGKLNELHSLLYLLVVRLQKYQDVKIIKGQDLDPVRLLSSVLVFISISIKYNKDKGFNLSPLFYFLEAVKLSKDVNYDVYESAKIMLKNVVLYLIEDGGRSNFPIIEKINKISIIDNRFFSKETMVELIEELRDQLSFFKLDSNSDQVLNDLYLIANSYSFLINLIKKLKKYKIKEIDFINEILYLSSNFESNINTYIKCFDSGHNVKDLIANESEIIKELVYIFYMLSLDIDNLYTYEYEPFDLYKIDGKGKTINDLYTIDNLHDHVDINLLIDNIKNIDIECQGMNYFLKCLEMMFAGEKNKAFDFIKKANSAVGVKLNIISKFISLFYVGVKLSVDERMSPAEYSKQILNFNLKNIPRPNSYYTNNIFIDSRYIESSLLSIGYDGFERNVGFFNIISKYNNSILKSGFHHGFIFNPLRKINNTLLLIFKNLPDDNSKYFDVVNRVRLNDIKINDIKINQSEVGLHNVSPDILLQMCGLQNEYGIEINNGILLFLSESIEFRRLVIESIEKNTEGVPLFQFKKEAFCFNPNDQED